ncbi:MAG: response regulator [Opitutales bacterium]|nr:response regulator [Opitutales bacterium]NRA28447.1 response regulator [Opitutales bacterium]
MEPGLNTIDIALIDDSEDDILMMREAVALSAPLKITEVFHNGMEALEKLILNSRPAQLPDLILLDINMPRINGFDVIRKLKNDARLRIVPTILLTTSNREEDVLKAYALGASSYIQKPFEFDELVNSTRCVASYWSAMLLPNHNLRPQTF